MDLQTLLIPFATLALGIAVGFFAGRSGQALLRAHIAGLTKDIQARESLMSDRAKRDDAVVRAFLHRLDVHPDDGSQCKTIDRSMRRLAQLARQRKAAEQKQNNADWEQVNKEMGVEAPADGNG